MTREAVPTSNTLMPRKRHGWSQILLMPRRLTSPRENSAGAFVSTSGTKRVTLIGRCKVVPRLIGESAADGGMALHLAGLDGTDTLLDSAKQLKEFVRCC